MADSLSPFALNVEGVRQLVESDTNKHGDSYLDNSEGVESEKYDSLSVKMTDTELLALRNEYEKRYGPYEAKLKPRVDRIRESYIGTTATGAWINNPDEIVPANEQFMAEETYLAAALAKNPEPVVYADNTEEGNLVSTSVKTMLQFHADQLVLRRKLAFMVRQHSMDLLGVLKPGWNAKLNDVAIDNRKVRDYIFDPNGYVDQYGDFTSWYGERITVTAEKLIEEFPDKKEYIKLKVDGKLGTEVVYTEWWPNDEFCFYTFGDVVLDKFKNPYFNYPEPVIDPLTGEPALDDMGEPLMTEPKNHFAHPKKPGIFLSIYSLHEQPHDITSLVEQNIPNQRRISRMTEQIDANISASNNGYAYSSDFFNQETAKQAANARKKGNPILIPSGEGSIDGAIKELPAQDIPNGFFAELENAKTDLRTSWGINGIAAQPADEDQTARGMILNQSHDTTRIGGGIGDAIEQVADSAFNWLVQLYYVFYDEQHFAAVMGNAKAVEYVTISNMDLNRQLVVSVAPDSLKPKDEVTQINLAQALFDKGAIGPKTLLKMLDFPDPDEAAADGALYHADPIMYLQLNFPDLAAQLQQAQQEKAMLDMANQAQGTAMNAQAEASALPPEANTEPNEGLAMDPASAALSNVQLPA